MTKEDFLKLLRNRDLAEGLMKCSCAEDVQNYLREKGIDVTIDDLNTIRKEVSELSDKELDNVAGGGFFSDYAEAVKAGFEDFKGEFGIFVDAVTDSNTWEMVANDITDFFKSW